MTDLKAMIFGAGFAGQGHALALRDCGVDIVAMASRTPSEVGRVTRVMGIPVASTDWRKTLREIRPDIVAVGTPAGTHVEMVEAALELKCHVLVDKPLAPTADAAHRLFEAAGAAGVKTAYAATSRYQPAVLLAKELVARGEIGKVREAECVSHYHWPRLTSFGWPHRLETGGGRLNNNFTHKLSIILNVLGGTVLTVAGESRNDLKRVPVGPPSHDFRNFATGALSQEEAARCEWREVDSDWAYTVLTRIGPPGSDPKDAASATFRHSALFPAHAEDYVAFYGDTGTIHIVGAYAQGALRLGRAKNDWREVPIPLAIEQGLPPIKDDAQRNWNQLAREFVADIRGRGDAGYLKFRDGWLHKQVIDAVRSGAGWRPIAV